MLNSDYVKHQQFWTKIKKTRDKNAESRKQFIDRVSQMDTADIIDEIKSILDSRFQCDYEVFPSNLLNYIYVLEYSDEASGHDVNRALDLAGDYSWPDVDIGWHHIQSTPTPDYDFQKYDDISWEYEQDGTTNPNDPLYIEGAKFFMPHDT